jgi:hypothetical protein
MSIKMLESNSMSLASAAAGLVLTALLTIPALIGVLSHFREPKRKPAIYEDEDGAASEESMAAYTAKVPKILLSIFTIVGFATAVSVAVLGTLDRTLDPMFLENWLTAGQWVCIRRFISREEIKN